jgi:hypothetical protein
MKWFLVHIIIILLSILFAAKVLWPRVMPQILPGIKQNPSFLSIIGLMILVRLLFGGATRGQVLRQASVDLAQEMLQRQRQRQQQQQQS